eukprot:scaffold79293_cov60-Phaeocystis_antarctica.AAC.1
MYHHVPPCISTYLPAAGRRVPRRRAAAVMVPHSTTPRPRARSDARRPFTSTLQKDVRARRGWWVGAV